LPSPEFGSTLCSPTALSSSSVVLQHRPAAFLMKAQPIFRRQFPFARQPAVVINAAEHLEHYAGMLPRVFRYLYDLRSSMDSAKPDLVSSTVALDLSCLSKHSVWIENEFFRRALVKVFIARRSLIQSDNGCIHDLGDGQAVV
jgi:hypothetical protein